MRQPSARRGGTEKEPEPADLGWDDSLYDERGGMDTVPLARASTEGRAPRRSGTSGTSGSSGGGHGRSAPPAGAAAAGCSAGRPSRCRC